MNPIHPKKLLHSKWTAVVPVNKEKHFVVIEVEQDEDGAVIACVLEAIMSKKSRDIEWRTLKDGDVWRQGWV